MLWVIDGLVYGFFTAIYTLFNQHYKLNGYVLGIWRGFGISLAFMPFLYFFPVPESAYYWFLLIFQGLLIGIYDSHLFFASADFGAGPTSRFMAITALVTTFLWWFLTPEQFEHLLGNGTADSGFVRIYGQLLADGAESGVAEAGALYSAGGVCPGGNEHCYQRNRRSFTIWRVGRDNLLSGGGFVCKRLL